MSLTEPTIRRRKKSTLRKAQLVELAAQIFVERGYRETGIEAVLKQAGLTGPALYRHFSSKQEILDTICLSAGQAMAEMAHSVQEEPGLLPRERMVRLIERRLDFLFSPAGNASFLAMTQRAHLSAESRAQLEQLQREFGSVFFECIRGFRPELSPEDGKMIFYAVQTMVIYGIWRSRARGLMSDAEYRVVLEKMIWNTLMA